MPLNYTLKMVKTVKFMLYIHNHKKLKHIMLSEKSRQKDKYCMIPLK